MRESLTQRYEKVLKNEADERARRYALEEKIEKLEKALEEARMREHASQQSIGHWETQAREAQGHIYGMREVLLRLGIAKLLPDEEKGRERSDSHNYTNPPPQGFFR